MDNKLNKALFACVFAGLHALALLLMSAPQSALANAAEPIVLALRVPGESFDHVIQGVRDELGSRIKLIERTVTQDTAMNTVANHIESVKPNLIVLIGNAAIRTYTNYQQHHDQHAHPPAVALAALYIDRLLKEMSNTTGIRYEIPAVIGLMNARALLAKRLRKVGVVYRSWMRDFVDENADYARSEEIELIQYELPNNSNYLSRKLREGLTHLLKNQVDAFWIVNDNALLTQDTFINAWLPVLGQADLPVIVGVKSLVKSDLNFGTYATIPDHYALGVQAASMIFDIMNNNWSVQNSAIQHPLSVTKIVNMKVLSHKGAKVNKERLNEVDEVIW